MPETVWNTEGFPHKIFWHCETKSFDGKSWNPPIMHKIFRNPKFPETQEGSPSMFFGTVRRKISPENRDTLPPLIHNFFRYQKFSETQKSSAQNFSALWDKKFPTENRDTPSLIHNFFHTRNFLKHRRVPLRIFSVLWDKKFSLEILVTSPPSIHNFFPYQKFSETQKGSRTIFFGPVRQKKSRQNRYAFRSVMLPPPMHRNIRFQIFLKQNGSPTNFFGTVRQKNSTENSDIPFLCIKFFDTRNFLKHRSVLQWNFLILRQNNFERSLLHKI